MRLGQPGETRHQDTQSCEDKLPLERANLRTLGVEF